jgi:hypothetical protein
MKPVLFASFASLVIAAAGGAQSTQHAVPATLLASIDAQKTKTGDEVSAQTGEDVKSEGRILVPKGSRLVGHVIEVKARTDDQPTSQIVLTFDSVVMKDGKDIPVTASVASISRAQGGTAPSDAGGGALGVSSTGTGTLSATRQEGHAAGNTAGRSSAGAFTLQQRASRTVISSNSENVQLASGTQLLVHVKARE